MGGHSPLALGDEVRLKPFWGAYAGPQTARIVDVYPDTVAVKLDPPLAGVAWWKQHELRRVAWPASQARWPR